MADVERGATLLPERSAPAPERSAPAAGARSRTVAQVGLVIIGLCFYSLTPLLVNVSARAREPSTAKYAEVTLPARGSERTHLPSLWPALDLAHRDGVLFVEKMSRKDCPASKAGVLPGDDVALVTQDGRVLFNRDERLVSDAERLEALAAFLQQGTNAAELDVDPARPVVVRFDFDYVEQEKGTAYLSASVILMSKLFGAAVYAFLAFVRDPRGLRELRIIYNFSFWWQMIPAIVFSLFAGMCELTANQNLPAPLYQVLSRLVLIGTAVSRYFVLGQTQTLLQTSILLALTMLILCYAQIPDNVPVGKHWDGFGQARDPKSTQAFDINTVGLLAVIGQIFGAVLSVTLKEQKMKSEELENESMIVVQGIISTVGFCLSVPMTLHSVYFSGWRHGFFGGGDVRYWHCSQDWTRSECLAQPALEVIHQGWDARTVVVMFAFAGRELALNALVKEFSSLARALVSAVAIAFTYCLSVGFLGKPFNLAKCLLIIGLVLTVFQYALAPKAPAPKKPTGFSSARAIRAPALEMRKVEMKPESDASTDAGDQPAAGVQAA